MEKRKSGAPKEAGHLSLAPYLEFFSLKRAPFSITPDPMFLVPLVYSQEALTHILYSLNSDGVVVITGDSGTGKTTVARTFIDRHKTQQNVLVGYVHLTNLSLNEFLSEICAAFQLPNKPDATPQALFRSLEAFLLRQDSARRRLILIIDEAQALAKESLEMLRALTNIEHNGRKLLQLVLMGQPELNRMLAHESMTALDQRIVARYHLKHLSSKDWQLYINKRLEIAGAKEDQEIFTPEAAHLIGKIATGIARKMNILAERSMVAAFVLGADIITPEIVRQAYIDLKGGERQSPVKKWKPWLYWGLGGVAVVAVVATGVYFWPQDLSPTLKREASDSGFHSSLPLANSSARLLKESVWMMSEDGEGHCSSAFFGKTLPYECGEVRLDPKAPEDLNLIRVLSLPVILNQGLPTEMLVVGLEEKENGSVQYRARDGRSRVQLSTPSDWDKAEILLPVPQGFTPTLKEGDQSVYVAWLKQALSLYGRHQKGLIAPQSLKPQRLDRALRLELEAFEENSGLKKQDEKSGLEAYVALMRAITPEDRPIPSLNSFY